MIGVYWGRIGQYGWHVVGGFLLAVAIVLVMTWISRRKNREVTKTTTKKLFGLKFLMVVLCAVSVCSAQGPPPIEDPNCEQHPVVFGLDKAPEIIDDLGEWIACQRGYAKFLSDWWPTNLSQNISRNMTA
jgi:hypothetical protein